MDPFRSAPTKAEPFCSFCLATQRQIACLIAAQSDGVHICERCVAQCVEIVSSAGDVDPVRVLRDRVVAQLEGSTAALATKRRLLLAGLELADGDAHACRQLLHAASRAGDEEGALLASRRIPDADRTVDDRLHDSVILERLGKYDDAVAALDALARDGELGDAARRIVALHRASFGLTNRDVNAVDARAFQRAADDARPLLLDVAMTPEARDILAREIRLVDARLARHAGDLGRAEELLHAQLDAMPGDPMALAVLAGVLAAGGDVEGAKAARAFAASRLAPESRLARWLRDGVDVR